MNGRPIRVSALRHGAVPVVEVGWSARRPLTAYCNVLQRLGAEQMEFRRYGSGALALADVAGGAVALFGTTWLGIPVSTTHTITGSIVGVGAARRVSAVRWGVARSIVIAWGITLPASALVAAGCYWLAVLIAS